MNRKPPDSIRVTGKASGLIQTVFAISVLAIASALWLGMIILCFLREC